MSLIFRAIDYGSAEYDAAVALRRRVLRAPLGLDFTPAQLAAEADDTHLAAFLAGDLVATLVLTPYDDATVKLRQMAVTPGRQGQAIGAGLVAFAEASAHTRGVARIILHARVSARAFYEKAGYRAQGDVFTEVTVPHIEMTKSL